MTVLPLCDIKTVVTEPTVLMVGAVVTVMTIVNILNLVTVVFKGGHLIV